LLLLDKLTTRLAPESARAIEAALAGFPGPIDTASHDACVRRLAHPNHTTQRQRAGLRPAAAA
jgi:ATPase subunit of ABC transporter with duplicated ATPase domains